MKKYFTYLLLLISCNVFAQIPFNGLVAYYPFNGNANDSSSNHFNGIVNGPTLVAGECGQGYQFNDNYIDCGDPAGNEFDITGDATLCCWFKLAADPGNGPGFTLIGKDVSGGSVPKWFVSILSDSVAFHMNNITWGPGYWRYSDYFHFSVDTFYHLAITKSGNNYQFFINAIPFGTRTFPNNVPDVPADLQIGQNELIGTNCVIDEVLLYNRVLSQQEITQVYTACNVKLTAAFNTADSVICAGSCISFINTSSAATSYRWSFPGAATATSTDVNPADICFNNPGLYDVQLIASDGTNEDTLLRKMYIKVNKIPSAGFIKASLPVICSGEATTLTDSGFVGTIQWQSSPDSILFSDISGATTSAYSTTSLSQTTFYRVTTRTTCGTDSSTVNKVTVNAIPSAGVISSIKDTICQGTVAHLNVTGNSGTLVWQASNVSTGFNTVTSAGGNSYSSPPLERNTLYRTIATNGSCSDTSAVYPIFVNPSPLAAYNITVVGHEVSFNSDSSAGAFFYSWDFGDGDTSTTVNPTYTYDTSGTFHVCLTVSNNTNCNFTVCKNLTIYPTSVKNIMGNAPLLIYPNPVDEQLYISNPTNAEIEGIRVFDMEGRVIININKTVDYNEGLTTLNFSELASGMYYLKVRTKGTEFTQKIVKQ